MNKDKKVQVKAIVPWKALEKNAITLQKQAVRITVKNEMDAVRATAMLGEIKTYRDGVDAERLSWVRPLQDYVKRLNEQFKTMLGPLDEVDQALRGALLGFRGREEAKNARRIEKAQEKGTPLSKNAISVATPTSYNSLETQTVVSKVWDFEVVCIKKVPKHFLDVKSGEIRGQILQGVRTIRGLRIFQKEILSVVKTKVGADS